LAVLTKENPLPQRTLFDGWNICDLRIDVHLNVNRPGGRITVAFTDETGKLAGQRSVGWSKDRDVSDLGLVLRDVANAFLFAPQQEALEQIKVAAAKHMPEVPSGV
jgi:hypothetical protein